MNDAKRKDTGMFKAGQKVVLIGPASVSDREIFTFNDPVSFVEMIRKSDKSNVAHADNEAFMHWISKNMREYDIAVPAHSEAAFVSALIRYGVFRPAVLN